MTEEEWERDTATWREFMNAEPKPKPKPRRCWRDAILRKLIRLITR